jgi:hypothetical protein
VDGSFSAIWSLVVCTRCLHLLTSSSAFDKYFHFCFHFCLIIVFVYAAYVGLATIAGFVWWFVYSESGPRLPYSELVSWGSEIFSFFAVTFWCLLGSLESQ